MIRPYFQLQSIKTAGLLVFLSAFSLLQSCKNDPGATAAKTQTIVDSNAVKTYLTELASDAYLGRKPFTEGETKTVNYLKDQLQAMGLSPGPSGSYFQEVPLVEITGTADPEMQIISPNGNITLRRGTEFVASTQREVEEVALEKSELVFCGFGIVAPEYNWNDYAGIDMKGKTAVVLVNDPGFESGDSLLFKGNTMTYYGRWTYKYEEAARQGAAGVLIIHETAAAGYPWLVVQNSFSGAKLNLQTPNGNADKCAVQGWISPTAASKILKLSPTGVKGIMDLARQPGFKPIPLGVTTSVKVKNTLKRDVSKNVVAVLPGTEKADEYILYSAHWDHLGVGNAIAGDSIYNGAEDNASGTASLLAIAKAFSEAPEKPKRSVIFLWVTAEEQGLLGSAYYAENPLFDPEMTVANLNMDGMNTNGQMKDFTIVGFGQSEMDDISKEEAAGQDRYIMRESEPEKGYFFRSDHFNFAKIGIPALFAQGNADHRLYGKEYATARKEAYLQDRYHQPADQYDDTWDLRGLMEDAQLYYNIGVRLSGGTEWPNWKDNSEFKAKRKRQALMK